MNKTIKVKLDLSKPDGGAAPVDEITIPDLWHVATHLRMEARRMVMLGGRINLAQSEWNNKAADMVLEAWHKAHAMRRTLSEMQEEA